jgi:hypothetical protein
MECDGCTLCCKTTNIVYMNSSHGEYCKHCIPNIGCSIHIDRPDPCKVFQCAWSQMENVHIDLRPDNCKVVFEKINRTLMLGSIDDKIENASQLVSNQITAFGKEGISTMLQQYDPHKFICKIVPGANKQEIINALEKKANDSTKLHRRLN